MRKKNHSCGQAKVKTFSPASAEPEVNAIFEIPEALRLECALREAIRRANLVDQRSAEPLICVRVSNGRFIIKTNPTLDMNGDVPPTKGAPTIELGMPVPADGPLEP